MMTKIGTWNVRSLYRIYTWKYNQNIERLKDIRLPGSDRCQEQTMHFTMGKGPKTTVLELFFLVKKCLETAVKKIELVNDRKSHLIL
jgi:hypothetical protein